MLIRGLNSLNITIITLYHQFDCEFQRFQRPRQGGPPVLPTDPVGDWLDLGEDHRLQLQVPSSDESVELLSSDFSVLS